MMLGATCLEVAMLVVGSLYGCVGEERRAIRNEKRREARNRDMRQYLPVA